MKISRKYETFSSESDDENYDESSSIDEETEKKRKVSLLNQLYTCHKQWELQSKQQMVVSYILKRAYQVYQV